MIKSYKLFTQENCYNCKAVKNCLQGMEISGREIDCASAEGFEEAKKNGVCCTPYVFLDFESGHVEKCTTVERIKEIFQNPEKFDENKFQKGFVLENIKEARA